MTNLETLITTNLDTWSSAIKAKAMAGQGDGKKQDFYGIRKLRRLIRDLAVEGHLVTQDAADEPASKFLEESAEIKAKLTKEGKIKKQEDLPPIPAEDIPFPLPKGWSWEKLGNLVEMYNGRAFKPSEWANEGLPIVRIQNLNDEFAPFNYYVGDLSENHRISDGTFLISWSGTPGTSFGAFIWKRGEAALNQHINKCKFHHPGTNLEFMQLVVTGQMDHFISKAQGGVGLKHVTKGTLNNAILAIPPKSEQRHIVAKVGELMALCDQLEKKEEESLRTHQTLVNTLLEDLTAADESGEVDEAWKRIATSFETLFTTESSIDELKKTILQLAVRGKLIPFSADRVPQTVGDHVDFQNGYAFKSEWFKASGIRLCRNVNVSHGILDWSESVFVDENVAQEFQRFALSEGDIVLSLDRPLITTGLKVARVQKADLPCLLLQRVAKPVPKHCELDLSYFHLWLNSPDFTDSIDPGRSNGVPHISTRQVQKLPFVLPPLPEQRLIVTKVDELMGLCERLKTSLSNANSTQLTLADRLVEAAII